MLKVPAGTFCDAGHALQWAHENGERLKAKRAKEGQKQAHKAKREFRDGDIRHQHKLTQTAANKLCLLLDKGKPCVSCGAPDTGKPRSRNASHYRSRGANSAMRYSLINLHASCVPCNLYQSGNVKGYAQGLTERYGSAMVEYLDSAPRVKAWEASELILLRQEVNEEIRLLQTGQQPSRNWRELPSPSQPQ